MRSGRSAPKLGGSNTGPDSRGVVDLGITVTSDPTFALQVLAFSISALLGITALDLAPDAPLYGDVLASLFAGVFGAPILVDAMGGAGIHRQMDDTITIPWRAVLLPAAAGALAGAGVDYLPGVSSAIVAVIALLALPGSSGDRGF